LSSRFKPRNTKNIQTNNFTKSLKQHLGPRTLVKKWSLFIEFCDDFYALFSFFLFLRFFLQASIILRYHIYSSPSRTLDHARDVKRKGFTYRVESEPAPPSLTRFDWLFAVFN